MITVQEINVFNVTLCYGQRASRAGGTRSGGGEHVRRAGEVDSAVHGMTGDTSLDRDDDWPYVAIQAGKSHGDCEFPGESTPRPVHHPKPRLDDFSGDIIGDDLLPT